VTKTDSMFTYTSLSYPVDTKIDTTLSDSQPVGQCKGSSSLSADCYFCAAHNVLSSGRCSNIFTAAKAWIKDPTGAAKIYGDISEWDTSRVTDMSYLFENSKLNLDISEWDVSKVTNMKHMFANAPAFNGDISKWDVARVTNMQGMFSDAVEFNSDISKWKLSAATDTAAMFYGAHAFNQDLSEWYVSKVTNMVYMFFKASSFDQDLSKWDLSSVQHIRYMLSGATKFSYPLQQSQIEGKIKDNTVCENTKLSDDCKSCKSRHFVHAEKGYCEFHTLVRTDDDMHKAAKLWVHNQGDAENLYGKISEWDTSRVTNMAHVFNFENAQDFNGDISKWDTSKATSMQQMFLDARAFNADISNWDTSKVTDMYAMFFNANSFNGDVSKWHVSNVETMQAMFHAAKAFRGVGVENWDTSKVSDMSHMFSEASEFSGDVSKWDVSNVNAMDSMFESAQEFHIDVSKWKSPSDTHFCIWVPALNSDTCNCDTDLGYTRDSKGSCHLSNRRTDTDIRPAVKAWLTYPTDAEGKYGHIRDWDTSSVTNMNELFDNSVNTGAVNFNDDISGWDVSRVTTMEHMFSEAKKFNQDISKWKLSSVTNMKYVFYKAEAFDKDLSKWSAQLTGVDIHGMFFGTEALSYRFTNSHGNDVCDQSHKILTADCKECGNNYLLDADTKRCVLRTIRTDADIRTAVTAWLADSTNATRTYGDISDWDTSRVTDMSYLFCGYNGVPKCNDGAQTFNSDISKWNTTKVTKMDVMFTDATAFNGDISKWDTSRVTGMHSMFHKAESFNADISDWKMHNVESMTMMFDDAYAFNGDVSKWDLSNANKAFHKHSMFLNALKFNQLLTFTSFAELDQNTCRGVQALSDDCKSCASGYTDQGGRCVPVQ